MFYGAVEEITVDTSKLVGAGLQQVARVLDRGHDVDRFFSPTGGLARVEIWESGQGFNPLPGISSLPFKKEFLHPLPVVSLC